jgi:hypothetical protein
MLGKVLSRIADSPEAELTTRNLLVGDLRTFINIKERREVSRIILPKMLTDADTKRPRRLGDLSKETGLDPQGVLGCLLDLELDGTASKEPTSNILGAVSSSLPTLSVWNARSSVVSIGEATRPAWRQRCGQNGLAALYRMRATT